MTMAEGNTKGVRYPDVDVALVGEDGNAFAVIGRVSRALKQAGVPREEVSAFQSEAMSSGSYDNLLNLCMQWVNVH